MIVFKKTPKVSKGPKPPKIKVQKTRKIGNRTLIGILSIFAALLICFGVVPSSSCILPTGYRISVKSSDL